MIAVRVVVDMKSLMRRMKFSDELQGKAGRIVVPPPKTFHPKPRPPHLHST